MKAEPTQVVLETPAPRWPHPTAAGGGDVPWSQPSYTFFDYSMLHEHGMTHHGVSGMFTESHHRGNHELHDKAMVAFTVHGGVWFESDGHVREAALDWLMPVPHEYEEIPHARPPASRRRAGDGDRPSS